MGGISNIVKSCEGASEDYCPPSGVNVLAIKLPRSCGPGVGLRRPGSVTGDIRIMVTLKRREAVVYFPVG